MKEQINYRYNIYIDTIYKKPILHFYYNNIKYEIISYIDNINEINDITKVLNNNNICVNNIIYTKDNKYYFEYKKIKYIIIQINSIEDSLINIRDIVKYNILVKNKKSNEYNTLCEIIDNFENKLFTLGEEDMLFQNISNYFIGLSENVVSYMMNTINETNISDIYIEHKRIKYNKNSELIDINNIEYNYRMKDIGMYFNNKVINREDYYEELDDFFKYNKLSNFDYRILFCEIVFPYYFYDSMYDVDTIINNIKLYENEYKYIYKKICTYENIQCIDWLCK